MMATTAATWRPVRDSTRIFDLNSSSFNDAGAEIAARVPIDHSHEIADIAAVGGAQQGRDFDGSRHGDNGDDVAGFHRPSHDDMGWKHDGARQKVPTRPAASEI